MVTSMAGIEIVPFCKLLIRFFDSSDLGFDTINMGMDFRILNLALFVNAEP